MSTDGGKLFGLNRTQLTMIGGILCFVGVLLFLAAASSIMAPSPDPFDFNAAQARMYSAFATALAGMILLGIGVGALRFGLIRPVTSYVASEAPPAIIRASEAAAVGLKEGLGRAPFQEETIVKLKCQNCGYLENEDAKFCGRCGKPL